MSSAFPKNFGKRGVFGLVTAFVACALVAALILLLVPSDSAARLASLLILYLGLALTATGAIILGARRTRGWVGRFWGILGAGVLARALGDAGWIMFTWQRPAPVFDVLYQTAWLISYLLLFLAVGLLVVRANRSLALLAAIDALAIMLSVGIMAYYFVIEPVLANPDGLVSEVWIGLPSVVPELLRRPAADVTLLFLSLAVLSTEKRPRWVELVSAGFLAFCVADALLLRAGATFRDFEADSALSMFWALGLALFGIAALASTMPELSARGEPKTPFRTSGASGASEGRQAPGGPRVEESEPSRPLFFWLGPISPATLYGFLLLWMAFSGSIAGYVLVGAALLLVYLALRISILTQVNRRLSESRDERVRKAERGRIASELDETLLNTVHAVPSMLDSYRVLRRTNPEAAEETLREAENEARRASYRLSQPVKELRTLSEDTSIGPDVLVDQLLFEVETSFGIQIHRSLEASPEDLTSEELASIYRIVSEALWNAAKHSEANNIWVSTRYVGSIFLVKVRDDGRGYDAGKEDTGLGTPLMRGRASSMGATLDLISRVGVGTTVQIRFDAGRRKRHRN